MMTDELKGNNKVWTELFKKYLVEICLLTAAIAVCVFSSWLMFLNSDGQNCNDIVEKKPDIKMLSGESNIEVDVSGAVNKPGLYKASYALRLKDAIDLAGGLSSNADTDYFYRNFNLSRKVTDEEKIYIPSVSEVSTGEFQESRLGLATNIQSIESEASENSHLVDINKSSSYELESLPGIGPALALKIIDNRPFKALDELYLNKIISKKVFEDIREMIKI